MANQRFTKPNLNADDPAFLYLELRPKEEIEYLIRHHWIGFLGTLVTVLAMAILPAVVLIILNLAEPTLLANSRVVIAMIATLFYLFLSTFLFSALINYYYNILIITNERLINISQEGLLSRKTSELNFAEIENVSADVNGFVQSWFNFGLLVVETAGGGTSGAMVRPGYFTIQDVPDPNQIARTILDLKLNAGGAESGE